MQKISALFQNYPRWTSLFAGAISASGFEPWGLWPLTLICFALSIHLIAQADSWRRAAVIGWLFGVGHFSIGNQWIAVAFTFQAAMPIWLGYFAVLALALYLAIYPALAAWGAWRLSRLTVSAKPFTTLPLILAFAGCWIITEWLRSWVFTGFAWNPLAVISISRLAAPATWLGTYGLSGLIIMFCGMLVLVLKQQWRHSAIIGGAVALVFIAVKVGNLGVDVDFGVRTKRADRPALTIVQPNISQADKYAPGYDAINFAKLAMNSRPLPFTESGRNRPEKHPFEQTVDAARTTAKKASDSPRLILWPEAALPDYLEDGYPSRYYQFQPGESAAGARKRLTTLMGEGDVLVTGANRLVIEKGQLVAARNSVSALDAAGNLLGHYDKAHLVPYGEYLPLPWLLRPLGLARLVPGDLDFWPGPGAQTMTISVGDKPVKIGMQICYEIIFSGQVVDRKNRPDFIFNPSNDAWFGTVGPPQHLAQARLRAIEEGLPVVRATPTGISVIIDANGRVVESLQLGTAGRIDARLPVAKAPTLFARYGNTLPLAFAALLIVFALLPLARWRTSR